MLTKSPSVCCSLLALLLLASRADSQFHFHHPPYQDQHFDLHQTPLYHYGTGSTYSDYGSSTTSGANGTATCSSRNGGVDGSDNLACSKATGSRSPKCPPVDNAILKLWVPDEFQVEVNGQKTKPQTLGGIHRNSRIFTLQGLSANRVSACEISVAVHNEFGETIIYSRSIAVQAGEHCEVRYPDGFDTIPTSFQMPGDLMMSNPTHQGTGEVLPLDVMQNAPIATPH